MKTKTACFILLAMMAALWGTWSHAFHRGYSQGSRDEFYCWKQEPVKVNDSWDGTLIGRRDAWSFPGGKPVPAPRISHPNTGAKNIIDSFSITK
jgi:hypothetical protein